MGNKIHFTSLGCPRNLVDTEVMLGLVLQHGYEVTDQVEEADFLVVNTCGFLEAARQETLDTIGSLLGDRKEGAKLIATGCMVQKHSDQIRSAYPDVQHMLGSGDIMQILQALQAESHHGITSAKSFLEQGEVPRRLSTPKSFAYLKISEGCRKACAYCSIPSIKGPLKSKSVDQVLKEVHALLNQGVFEIILIAQDLGDYAKDRGALGNEGLVALLKEILKIERPFWLRLLYLYPDEITDELIELMRNDQRIVPYLDMPIQHIDNALLTQMRRHTNREQITGLITKLRERVPGIFLRTSLIVGFPGETEEQFESLVQFVQQYPLDHVGIFQYSREMNTPAGKMENQIAAEVKQSRWDRLMETQAQVSKARLDQLVAQELEVIVDGVHPDSELLLVGRHRGQCPDIDGQVILNDARCVKRIGGVYRVHISQVVAPDLVGQAIAPSQQWNAEEARAAAQPKKKSRLKLASSLS
jgi:ribosomal protein S12 methylthiotransferase